MTLMTKIYELSEAARVEDEEVRTAESADLDRKHRVQFVEAARKSSALVLGEAAAELLVWTYDLFADDGVDQASADLAVGSTWLQYGYDHGSEESWFRLVRHCSSCNEKRYDDIRSLSDLAPLLAGAVFAAESALAAQDGGE